MVRKNKERPGWTPERRAKNAATWKRRAEEKTALETASKINTKRQGKVCTYCGEQYEVREHVPILKARIKLPAEHRIKFVIVPACYECHHYLKFDENLTITDRRRIIKHALKAKYIAFLCWQEYDQGAVYLSLNHHYRDLIDQLNSAKQKIVRRLKYKEGE